MMPFADAVRAALPVDARVGREIVVFEETDSTNDLAARAGRDGALEGLAIFAEAQRAGRGRSGRRWSAPPGCGLLLSLLLRPPAAAVERWPELTFCAALAVAEAVEANCPQPARIKWPNDVLVAGRKLAGILLEIHRLPVPGFVVVGIGLNVLQRAEHFPPELRARATSLAMCVEPGEPMPDRPAVAAALLARFEQFYADWPVNFPRIRRLCSERGCVEHRADTDGSPASANEKGGP